MVRARDALVFLTATVGFLLRPAGGWTQQRASPPDTTEALATVLSELDSGQRIRLYLPERDPQEVPFARTSSDSLFVGEDTYTASVALSGIERLDVASHPYWEGVLLGAGFGAVIGGVIAEVSTSEGECPEFECPPDYGQSSYVVIGGSVTGGLGGAGLGFLVGSTITTWEQRYPPP